MEPSPEFAGRSQRLIRIGLWGLAAGQGIPALWALLASRSFFEDFPGGGRHWVSALGPYDQHLVTDYGASFLALAVLAAAAGVLLEPRLTRVAMACWLIAAVPHFVYHVTTMDRFGIVDNVSNLISLGLFVAIPVAILVALRGVSVPAGSSAPSSGGRSVTEGSR